MPVHVSWHVRLSAEKCNLHPQMGVRLLPRSTVPGPLCSDALGTHAPTNLPVVAGTWTAASFFPSLIVLRNHIKSSSLSSSSCPEDLCTISGSLKIFVRTFGQKIVLCEKLKTDEAKVSSLGSLQCAAMTPIDSKWIRRIHLELQKEMHSSFNKCSSLSVGKSRLI